MTRPTRTDVGRSRRLAKFNERTARATSAAELVAAACSNVRSALAMLPPQRAAAVAPDLASQLNRVAEEVLSGG